VSSITAIDLHGISKILELFTVVLAAAAMALFVTLALIERHQELATMAALGAPCYAKSERRWLGYPSALL
jgi:hypothetical protein